MGAITHPVAGARYLLERDEAAPELVRYRATIYKPTVKFEYVIDFGESVNIAPDGARADGVCEANLSAIAKMVARRASKVAEGPPWPRRVLRWRGPGRGKG
jgi:hypothetical protein